LSISTTTPSGLLGRYTPASTTILAISSSILAWTRSRRKRSASKETRRTERELETNLLLRLRLLDERLELSRDVGDLVEEGELSIVEGSSFSGEGGDDSIYHSVEHGLHGVGLKEGEKNGTRSVFGRVFLVSSSS